MSCAESRPSPSYEIDFAASCLYPLQVSLASTVSVGPAQVKDKCGPALAPRSTALGVPVEHRGC